MERGREGWRDRERERGGEIERGRGRGGEIKRGGEREREDLRIDLKKTRLGFFFSTFHCVLKI